MALRHPSSSRFHRGSSAALFLGLILVVPSITLAQSPTENPSTLTHREFADTCLRNLSEQILSGFTPNRTSPLVVVADSAGDPRGNLASMIAESLSGRGMLIRADSSSASADGNWLLRYVVSPLEMSLSDPQRREFLGKIWVKRTLRAEIDMAVQDTELGEVIWAGASDSTYSDWVKKSDLDALESAELKPRLPSTAWEKARLPIIVGAGALLAGSLMLALN